MDLLGLHCKQIYVFQGFRLTQQSIIIHSAKVGVQSEQLGVQLYPLLQHGSATSA